MQAQAQPEGAEANQRSGVANPSLDGKHHPEDAAEVNSSVADGPTDPAKADVEYITGGKLAAVTGSTALVAFLLMLDNSILSTAVPYITTHFHSLADVGWYVGVYPLTNAALQPITGKLYTYFSAKWTWLFFLGLFEVGSLVCALANSSNMLIGGRAISGLGASGIMNGAMTIIAGATPMDKRPMYTGIMMGFASLGVACGPLIGGALTEYVTWRWCFYINLPIGGVAAVVLVLIHIPELTVKEKFNLALIRKVIPELDLLGFALFAPAAIMFLLALQFGSDETYPWDSSVIIGLFVGAGVTAIVFFFWERHMGIRAMIPGPIVKQRIVWSSAGVNLTFFAALMVGSNYLPMYFQAVKGRGPTMSGVDTLPSILLNFVFAIVSGGAVSKMGYYLPWAVFSGAMSTIANGLISTWTPTTSTGKWVGYQIMLGAGRGSGMQMAMIAVQNAVAPHQIPISLGFLIFVQNIGSAVFFVLATTIFTQTLVSDIPKLAPSVSVKAALAAGGGAQAVRGLLPAGSPELMGLLSAYSHSIRNIFYLLAGLTAIQFFFAFGMGFKDVRKNKPGEKPADKVEKEEV